jgi:integrase
MRLTSARYDDKLFSHQRERGEFCMKGAVYTKEKCPVCGGKFQKTEEDFVCPAHLTRPRRVYIQLYSEELHKHINICSDSRGIPFSSYEQADRILTKIRAEIDAGSFDVTRYVAQKLKPLRFINWSENWLQGKEVEVQKGRLSPSYQKELRRFVKLFQDHFGETDIRDVTSKAVHSFYQSLDGSPKTVSNIMSCLHAMLSDAKKFGDIGIIPAFPKINVPESDIRTIDLDLQDKIVNAIADQMDHAYILFTAREMVRPSETRALWWEDIDFKHDRVTIRRHFSLNELRATTKAKQIKILPLDAETKAALERLPRHISSPFVFQRAGCPYSESYARKLWNKVCSENGVKISLYQGTRHSSATEAVDRVGMDRVQEFLGHTKPAMTRRYVKQNPNRLRVVLRNVENE